MFNSSYYGPILFELFNHLDRPAHKNPSPEFMDFLKESTESDTANVENKYVGHIRSVTFNPPYTTVVWEDGTHTRVVCPENVEFSKEQGLLNCMAKYLYENTGDFNTAIKYWLEHGVETDNFAKRTERKQPGAELFLKDIIPSKKDVYAFVNTLMDTTTPAGYVEDVFWTRNEKHALYTAILYVLEFRPENKKTLEEVLRVLRFATSSNNYVIGECSEFDLLFLKLKNTHPDSAAVISYEKLRKAAGKTLRTVIHSAIIHVQDYLELNEEEQQMARICPITNEKVLYAACVECDDKVCRMPVNNETDKADTEADTVNEDVIQ